MNGISLRNNLQITLSDSNKIFGVFERQHWAVREIERMISIYFVFMKIFKMLWLPHDCIKVTNSAKTLDAYEQYCKWLRLLIGDNMDRVIKG